MRSRFSFLIITYLLAGSIGCSTMESVDLPLPPGDDSLPSGAAGIALDVDLIPSYLEVKNQLDEYRIVADSQPLTAAECACLAASRSQMAAVLEKEAANKRREMSHHKRRGQSELLPDILMYRAAEERNNSAEEALVAYYQLAGVHLQNTVLAESYQELSSVRQTVRGLIDAGVPLDTDVSDLDRQQAELDRQNAELDVNEARLTARVKSLLDEDPYSPEAIETTCSIEPRPVGYELSEAMRIANQNDSQLKSIRRMLHHGTTDDLGTARGLLQVTSPLLGQAPVKLGFFAKLRVACGHNDSEEGELRIRKQQLRELEKVRQKQLDLEVANGVISVQQRFLDVGIAMDVLQSWESRVESLASQRELQKSNYQELVDAKVARLKAKSDLLNKLIQLEIEHAKLRGTMGLLGLECGVHGSSAGEMPEHPTDCW